MTMYNKAAMRKPKAYSISSSIIAITVSLCVAAIVSGCSKPDFVDTAGENGRFKDFQGKWLVINYWAEWCEPCREEIPEFNRFAHNHKDSAEVFAVSYDTLSSEQLAAQAERMNIEYRVLTDDPAALLGFRKPQVLPATYILKPDGSFYKELLGPQTEESIKTLLFTVE